MFEMSTFIGAIFEFKLTSNTYINRTKGFSNLTSCKGRHEEF